MWHTHTYCRCETKSFLFQKENTVNKQAKLQKCSHYFTRCSCRDDLGSIFLQSQSHLKHLQEVFKNWFHGPANIRTPLFQLSVLVWTYSLKKNKLRCQTWDLKLIFEALPPSNYWVYVKKTILFWLTGNCNSLSLCNNCPYVSLAFKI